ncbi:MAG TPA: hypothetical protein VGB53_13425 [Rubricoccaceae bacterium]|jgi:hypothetical protein
MRLLLLAVLLAGCVHTQPTTLATDAGRADLNARTAGRVATLHLQNGRHAVRDLHIGPDETTWTDRLSGMPQSVPTADVTAVSLRSGRVWHSLLIGAGIGAGIGVIAAASDNGGGWIRFSPAFYIGTGAFEGAVFGAGFGAAQTNRYRIEPDGSLGVRLDSLGRP